MRLVALKVEFEEDLGRQMFASSTAGLRLHESKRDKTLSRNTQGRHPSFPSLQTRRGYAGILVGRFKTRRRTRTREATRPGCWGSWC
jgi:hypothetical protein